MPMSRTLLPIFALLLSTYFLMAGAGLQGILLPVRGSIEGWSPYQIGWMGTGYAVAFTVGCLVVPRMVRQAGHVRTFASLAALLAIGILLAGIIVHPLAWILFRALSGFCLAGCYTIVESWLNERVTNESRGLVFSVYMVVTMAGMMAGQYVMPLARPEIELPFMLCAILFALAVIPTALSRAQTPAPIATVKLDIGMLRRNSPVAVAGVVLSGVLSGAWGNMAPVLGREVGLTTTQIATLLVVTMAGGIVFQIPLGRMSDRMDRRYVLTAAGLLGLAGAIAGTMAEGRGALFLFGVAFVLGGIIYPIYSIAVAHANDHARSQDFVKVAGGLLILYGFGTMGGPLLAAELMERGGPAGLFQLMGVASGVLALYAFYRTFRRQAPPAEARADFKVAPLAKEQTPTSATLDPRAADALAEDEAAAATEAEAVRLLA